MPRDLKEMLEKLKRAPKEPAMKPRDYFQRPKLNEHTDKNSSGDWSGSEWSGQSWSGRNTSGGRDR